MHPKSNYRHFVVHYLNRNNRYSLCHEGLLSDSMYIDLRHAWILILGEYIGELLLKLIYYRSTSVDRHRFSLQEIKTSHIVHPRHVIFVLVGEEQTIELGDLVAEHLLPKIRP